MQRSTTLTNIALGLALSACAGSAQQTAPTAAPEPAPETAPEPAAGDAAEPAPAELAEDLPTPFTAEEIRGEWTPGFTLLLRRGVGDEASRQRWTVVDADEQGVTIEFADVDEAGETLGEARANRSSWTELRDHALFPAAHARREETRRETPLGALDGWLYTVEDPETGTTTQLFFARDLPGAPVWMRTTRGDDVLDELEQLERRRPE